MISVWCPDWPVASTDGYDPERPIAVVTANLVVACSHAARRSGVRRGLRRREAQGRCPDLVVLPRDEAAEARAFEPVVAAVEHVAPGVEITRPGLVAVGARGPTRYFGGEQAVVHAVSRAVAEHAPDALVGVADGVFAAEQAARRGLLIEPGGSAAFLADLPVEVIELPELVDLLRRLGVRTLGAFAELPARDVLARFGPAGAWVHRQCGARDARPVAARRPATDHAVELRLDEPLDRVDTLAFSARSSVERFIGGLLEHGLACTCLELLARTDNGEETLRRWRQAGVLTAVDVLDRVRWQLEGWLGGRNEGWLGGRNEGWLGGRNEGWLGGRNEGWPGSGGPTAGVTLLRLTPVEVVPTGAHQQSLWGGSGVEDERAHRALARVQTLLGHGSVRSPVRGGGREPAARSESVPWGDETVPVRAPDRPWPGRLPAPAPSVLLDPPRPAQVLDGAGHPVVVTERGAVPNPPACLALGDGPSVPIAAWAGPWPVDERWWDQPESLGRPGGRARFQLVDLRGHAYLATCTLTRTPDWRVDAVYD